VGDRGGVARVRVHEHRAELVAADPDEHVRTAQQAGQPRAQLPEQLVAGGVAEGVVDLLEMVEVDEQEREAAPAGVRVTVVGEERVEQVEELATVAEAAP